MKKTRILLIASLLLAMSALSGCAGLRKVRPVSCRVESISPQGFRKIGMKIALGIDNPSVQFTVKDARAVLNNDEGPIGEIFADPVTIDRKCLREYPVDVQISLAKGFYLTNLVSLLQDPTYLDRCTVDLTVRVKLKGGAGKTLRHEDIPVKHFIQMIRL